MDRRGSPLRPRAAARKASKLVAEQLNSSSESLEGAAEANVSAQRASRSAKPKRSSPVTHSAKPSSSILLPRPTRTPSHSFNPISVSKPARRKSLLGKQNPAPGPFHDAASVALPSDSDSDIEFIGFGPASATFSQRSQSGPNLDKASAPWFIPSLKTPIPKKRILSNSERSPVHSLGSLTPLSSPETPRTRSAARKVLYEPASPAVENWSLADLGRLVWVCLSTSGCVSETRSNSVWWPAHVIGHAPTRICPFGQSPVSSSHNAEVEIVIDNPSQRNIRAIALNADTDILRFNERNYGGPSTDVCTTSFSPRKRQKTADHDLLPRWKEARKLMVKEDALENDGLPRFFAYDSDEDDIPTDLHHEGTQEDTWSPPLPKFEYDIPGELILSKDKANTTQYWPAKILDYVPPQHRKQKHRYRVLFFDRTVKDVTEDMFYTEFQAGFGTCKLGESEGNYGLDEEERDTDEDMTFSSSGEGENPQRENTPIPAIPPPTPFEALSIDEQFEYVKPVLVAILQNKYTPAWPRHEAFMGSAATRQKVINSDHNSGTLKGYELDQLGPLIRRWVRRRQMRQERGMVPLDACVDAPHDTVEQCTDPLPPPSTVGSEPDLISTTDIRSDDDAVTDPLSQGSLPPSSFTSAMDSQESVASSKRAMSTSNNLREDGTVTAATEAADEMPSVRQHVHDPASNVVKSLQVVSEYRSLTKYYAALSDLDQLTYCSSILLQEAKYQLLLWRHGLRHSFELLPPVEEEKLHQQAEAKAEEMDWVHAIILSRRAVENRMLPTFRNNAKPLTRLRSGRD